MAETIEGCDEDAAWRTGLMLHIETLMAVVYRDEPPLGGGGARVACGVVPDER